MACERNPKDQLIPDLRRVFKARGRLTGPTLEEREAATLQRALMTF
jgi:hypothetical protein